MIQIPPNTPCKLEFSIHWWLRQHRWMAGNFKLGICCPHLGRNANNQHNHQQWWWSTKHSWDMKKTWDPPMMSSKMHKNPLVHQAFLRCGKTLQSASKQQAICWAGLACGLHWRHRGIVTTLGEIQRMTNLWILKEGNRRRGTKLGESRKGGSRPMPLCATAKNLKLTQVEHACSLTSLSPRKT